MFNEARYQSLLSELNKNKITLVAVSKFKSTDDILKAYNAGQRDFGENYVQELLFKYEALPKDIRWHFIGHLQSNKVKFIAPIIHLIHGIDSEKLLKEADKQAQKAGRQLRVLLQVHIATEETKFGFNEEELFKIDPSSYPYVSICGLMGMASFVEDENKLRSEFSMLNTFFDKLKGNYTAEFNILSMGMSNDYKIAAEEGSTMVRIGSLIFGSRF